MEPMPGRTFAIGDIHGDLDALARLSASFPALAPADPLVFVGDYVDRGSQSREVIEYIRRLPSEVPARVVALRGNHEDAWLRVIDRGWPEFTLPPTNGCLSTLRSFSGTSARTDSVTNEELPALLDGSFFPPDVVAW